MNQSPALPTLAPGRQTASLLRGDLPMLAWLVPQESSAARLALELDAFAPISLAQMAEVALLDRIDTKYVLTVPQLLDALPALRAHYWVLAIDAGRQSPYRTLYFDTPDFELYRWHQAGRRVRYKVRSRQYVSTGLSFFEVKRKTGPNRTHKERFATRNLVTCLDPDACEFLRGRLPVPPETLEPKLWVDYTRVTLVSRHDRERLTLDLDLRFSDDGRGVELPGLVTAEVKHVGRPRASVFVQLMRRSQVRRNGFSKYCIGASLVYPDLKHNRFSRALRVIDQSQQGDA